MKKKGLLLMVLALQALLGMSWFFGWPLTIWQTPVQDGPYVFFGQQQQIDAQWVCDGEKRQLQQHQSAVLEPLCGFSKRLQIRHRAEPLPQVKFTAQKLAALSDIHGQLDLMQNLLRQHGIIDHQQNWSFGDGHLVIAGDVMDRGPAVTEILWFLYQLEQQAIAAGGQLHLLLGNHETMVLAGDLRYLNEKYRQVEAILGLSYQQLYSADSVLGDWLRSRPVLVQVNDSVFVHAGLHPDYLALGMTMTEVNEYYRASLGMDKATLKQQPVLDFLYGSLGPVWYRGYFREKAAIRSGELEQLLQQLHAKRVIVGHTSMDAIYLHQGGQVISLDSNIKKG
ncbi:MAG: metallophosphoesterase, partial [Gammaproteobacteria bacterium]|nr:metallophosphoesterase [Gammaproteobacteria bacterium]